MPFNASTCPVPTVGCSAISKSNLSILVINALFPNFFSLAKSSIALASNSTNLISALRLSLDLWKRENQVKNVQDIIKRGTLLYEKIAGFTDTFLRIGDNLSGLQRDYDKAYNQLSDGNGSVVRQAELLRNMSLTPKKRISARLLPKEEETEEEENGQDK